MLPYRVTADISLELVEPRHAEELYRVTDANREHLRRWLPWVDATQSVAHTRAFIQVTLKQLCEDKGFHTAIRFDGALVGMVGHHGIDWQNRSASLGYWLAADAQGKGIMTECCRVHVRHALDVLGLNRVEIRCATKNTRSRAIPERLGFRSEGVIRDAEWLYDHFVDHVVYAALAAETLKNNGG